MSNKRVPKRRFKQFKDDSEWEKKTLDMIFDEGGSGGTPNTSVQSYYNGDINFLSIADITNSNGYINKTEKSITEEGLKNSTAYIVPEGSISLAMYASVGKVAILNIPAATSQAFYNMTFKNKDVRDYMYFNLLKKEKNKSWEKDISTGTQRNLNAEKVRKTEIKIPEIKEQKVLGYFFTKLDKMIELQEEKVNKLKALKKSYLTDMFVRGAKSSLPRKRFKEFFNDGVWEEKMLGEIGYTYSSLSGKTKQDFDIGNSKYITYLNVFNNNIASKNSLERVIIKEGEKQNKVIKGDVFFTTSSETPEEVGMSSVWTFDIDNIYLNSFCFGYRLYNQKDLYFLANLFRSRDFRQKVELLAQGISRYNISKQRMMDISVYIPTIKEQKQIGKFFNKIDKLLEVQSIKLNKIKDIKQAYLNEMFVN